MIFIGPLAVAFAQNVAIDPPFADRVFPYITYSEVWKGTPASLKDVAVPNLLIVYGVREDPQVVAQAGKIAFYLGQWTDDIGFGVEEVKESRIPPLLVSDLQLREIPWKNIIVVGTNNDVVKSLGITFSGPTIKVVDKDGKKIMVVGGRNEKEVIQAARYLSDVRLNFKAGAYKTFFSFVTLRGLLEKGEWESALRLIKSPQGVSACGKNMSLAAPMVASWSDEVKSVVQKRNSILYKDLPEAIEKRDRKKAVSLWKEAMVTCYQCHQGEGIPQMRKFVPLESIHAKHQRIAESFGLSCINCHAGPTSKRGYSSAP